MEAFLAAADEVALSDEEKREKVIKLKRKIGQIEKYQGVYGSSVYSYGYCFARKAKHLMERASATVKK